MQIEWGLRRLHDDRVTPNKNTLGVIELGWHIGDHRHILLWKSFVFCIGERQPLGAFPDHCITFSLLQYKSNLLR